MNQAALAPPSPYKGLASFGEEGLDPLLFFGREREIEVIAANLIASRLTVLYGPSGVGKTSILKAGVVPRLREQGAEVLVFSSWSGDPFEGALDEPESGQRYVIVDQFEEFFLYHDDSALSAVTDLLRDREARTNVLISIREDALAQLDAFKGRIPGLFSNSLRLDRLDRASARRAITGPPERYRELPGADGPTAVAPALVEKLLDSVAVGRIQLGTSGRGGTTEADGGERIEAPFLQLVLERLWTVERDRGSNSMRLETLHELGGARRIVEEHLESAMEGLSAEDRDAAAAIYNHLVTPSGTKIAHRAGDLARYASVEEPEATRVLNHLAAERIVRAAEDGAGGPQYEIFHDVLADAVLGWRARHEADRRIDEARRQAQARHRRLLGLAAASLVAVAVLAGVAVYALVQRSEARENARDARGAALVAQAAALTDDPQRSLELTLAASRMIRTPAVENVLRQALKELRALSVTQVEEPPGEPALGANGLLLALAGGDAVRLYGEGGAQLLRTLRHPKVETAAISADGSRIATVGRDGAARIWTSSGRPIRTLRPGGQVQAASFSRDGRRLAVVSKQRVVQVFAPTGRLTARFTQPSRVLAVRFSPDGTLIATGGTDALARIWSAGTGKLLHTLRGHLRGGVGDVAFSPDGELLATGSTDGTARVWNTSDGGFVSISPGHEGFVSRVEFSPDGTLIATGSRDRKARIFEARSPTLRATLTGHTGSVTDLAWTRDGAALTTFGTDLKVWRWDARRFPTLRLVRTDPAGVGFVRFDEQGEIESWPPGPVDPRVRARSSDFLAVSGDGQLAITSDETGVVRLVDGRSGTPVRQLRRHSAPVTSARFSPDGRYVVTTSLDQNARLSQVETGEEVWVLTHSALVSDAAFSADGRWVAIAGPGEAGIVDAATGQRILLLDGRDPILTSIDFSPTGWRIVTGAESGAIRTYDCRLCGGIDELIPLAEARLAPIR